MLKFLFMNTIITLVLMISSIAKRQGYFWEPLSILALVILGGLAYRDLSIYTNVVNIASDLVEGLKSAALIAFTVGVLVYMIIAVVFVFLGSILSNDLVWELTDMFNQLMVIPNVPALIALSGIVAAAAKAKKSK